VTLLAPAYFFAALFVAAGAVGLHFLVTRQPPSEPLPTVRFVPPARVDVTTLTRKPEDLLLLLVRVLLVLLAGAAFARPVLVRRRPVARVILADYSTAVADTADVADSVRRIAADGDAVVPFRGTLSSALISGMRSGAALRTAADSLELVIVSPFARGQLDGATPAIRARWPGRIRLVAVEGRKREPASRTGVTVRGAADDALAVAVAAAGLSRGDSSVRVVRDGMTAADSALATGGGTLVRWPASGGIEGWHAREKPDTAGAVVVGDVAVVYPFPRRWHTDSADTAGVVVARWVDGAPAAVERRHGTGCIRDVSILVPPRGDLILRSDFARLLGVLISPCGAARRPAGAPPNLALLAGSGPLASWADVPAPEIVRTPLVPWLLAAALLLALLELRVRRTTAAPGRGESL
jgi:hypothetical protein